MDGSSGTPETEALAAHVSRLVDLVGQHYATGAWEPEISRARLRYDQARGTVYNDEELYAMHMAAFLEWYVAEYPLMGGDPPAIRALTDDDLALEQDDRGRCWALAHSHRSLFEVATPWVERPDGLRLLDLIGGGLWRVDLARPLAGLVRGDIFEARLLPWQGRIQFGPIFLYHPREAGEAVHQVLTAARQQGWLGPLVVMALAQMRVKHERSRNMPAPRVYAVGAVRAAVTGRAAGASSANGAMASEAGEGPGR